MTLSEADLLLRHAHTYLWRQVHDEWSQVYGWNPGRYRDLHDALAVLCKLIRENEVERTRALRTHFARPDVVEIGPGLYARTRGAK